MPVSTLLADYLERTLGTAVRLTPATLPGLPVYMRHTYRTWRTRLFGLGVVLAEARAESVATPTRLAGDVDALRRAAPDAYVAPVLRHLSRSQRTRLVAAGIPFIVPGRQMFLPNALVDLREHFPRARAARPRHLSAAAQFVVLRQLLRRDAEGKPLAELARTCGYSAMTLTNVRDELIAAGLCSEHGDGDGRAKPLRFSSGGRDLWQQALPLLRTPVRRVIGMDAVPRRLRVLDAGLTALARRTTIGEPRARTVAAHDKALRTALAARAVSPETAEDEPATLVEAWAYDPARLAEGAGVDPLSLWLSLRADPDERVQAALVDLLETHPW